MTEQILTHTNANENDDTSQEDANFPTGDQAAPKAPIVTPPAETVEASDPRVSTREVLLQDPVLGARQFAEDYLAGAFPVTVVSDAWTGMRRDQAGFISFFNVTESTVDALGISRDLFVDGKFKHPGADERDQLADFDHKEEIAKMLESSIDPDDKRAQLEAYYATQPANEKGVKALYKNDLADVERADIGLEKLRQVVDFSDTVGGVEVGNVRVLNFTETEISSETLLDLKDALLYVSEKSGGELYRADDGGTFDNIFLCLKIIQV